MIVVDASVLVTALADDGSEGTFVRQRIAREDLAAPEIADLEVTSVLRRLAAADQLSTARAEQALSDLHDLRIELVPHRPLLRRCWSLRHNLTVYDAAYVALAEALNAVLLTADSGMATTPGTTCSVELIKAP